MTENIKNTIQIVGNRIADEILLGEKINLRFEDAIRSLFFSDILRFSKNLAERNKKSSALTRVYSLSAVLSATIYVCGAVGISCPLLVATIGLIGYACDVDGALNRRQELKNPSDFRPYHQGVIDFVLQKK